ncbi:hypothetical protein [Streptomyces brasiliensis]|uniref:Uncharacterized protein n=1 Tax=Streptomyces brasiliensis TaxID=1954 RepID=A0A917UNG9_9ACTN|nr:hypothetical protein [Streptomyces brasiliensis]GGJ70568.1 hypothetical protein GCM10010121_096500 [Streptomyces brasiliensis]
MSTLTRLVILLLVLVGGILFGGLAYLAYRHPTWGQPLIVGLTGVGVLAAVVATVAR